MRLLIIAMLLPVLSAGQLNPKFKVVDYENLSFGHWNGDTIKYHIILHHRDSSIEIKGDTIMGIRQMFKLLFEINEKYYNAAYILAHLNLEYLGREYIKKKSFTEAVKRYRKLRLK